VVADYQGGEYQSGIRKALADVRYWPKADIPSCTAHVRFREQSGQCWTQLRASIAQRRMEKPPACDRGLSVHFRPNTHVAAFSRSMTSNEATHNTSAVPATIRMYVMEHLPP
jgi:hypothetical protein